MGKRIGVALIVGVVAAAGSLAASAPASNVIHPSTYTGTVAGGGTVEFEVSADGSAVTRFEVRELPVPCGAPVTESAREQIPIVDDSFVSNPLFGVKVRGSFPALQKAEGTVSIRLNGLCWSAVRDWTATTPTPPPDTSPPDTAISAGPKGATHKREAVLRFASTEAGSTFECKLDSRKWSACRPPRTYRHLREGHHAFRVKAIDAAGNVDPTPAKRTWRVEFG